MKHPVLVHDIDPKRAADYEKAVSRVMAMSEAEMLALVPTKSALLFCGCPNCSGGYGHQHADNLHFSLFAEGGELLSDLGYSHTKLRHWTVSTIGHNTVAIDRQGQSASNSDGDLLMFVPDLNGLAAVEARGERGYPKLAEVYRRELLLVPVSETDAYVVDIFRVKGGSVHDWLLHGSAEADMTAECSLPLTPREGTLLEPEEKWVEPVGESSSFNPYGLIREVRQGKAEGALSVTFRSLPPSS